MVSSRLDLLLEEKLTRLTSIAGGIKEVTLIRIPTRAAIRTSRSLLTSLTRSLTNYHYTATPSRSRLVACGATRTTNVRFVSCLSPPSSLTLLLPPRRPPPYPQPHRRQARRTPLPLHRRRLEEESLRLERRRRHRRTRPLGRSVAGQARSDGIGVRQSHDYSA